MPKLTQPPLVTPFTWMFKATLLLLTVIFALAGYMSYKIYTSETTTLHVRCEYKEKALSSLVCKEMLFGQ